MEQNNIQLGFDIATFISIIGAAISFAYSQHKNRKQNKVQYSVDNLKKFLIYTEESKQKFDQLGYELRKAPTQDNLDKQK